MRHWMSAGLALFLALLSACSKEAPPPEPIRPVLSITVQAEQVQQLGRYAGDIEARYESTLGFRVGGRIARRLLDVGDAVQKDQLLAVLDPTDQQNQLRSRQGDLARVQAQWLNAQASARRQQELFDRGVGAQAALDAAVTDLKTAQASRDQAQAAVDQARDQVNYSELRADHDAVITRWQVEAGQVVTVGQQVVTLARPDVKEAVIDLPSDVAERLTAGVQFAVAGQLDQSVRTLATLRELEPQADSATRTRRARLTLAHTPAALRLGTAISVTLTSAMAPRITLPATVLQNVDGQAQIWIVDPHAHTVSPRSVSVLSRNGDNVVLAAGVAVGERVVTAGVNSLKPGQQVKVDEEGAQ